MKTEFNQEHNTTMKRIKDTENFYVETQCGKKTTDGDSTPTNFTMRRVLHHNHFSDQEQNYNTLNCILSQIILLSLNVFFYSFLF